MIVSIIGRLILDVQSKSSNIVHWSALRQSDLWIWSC